MLAMKRFIYFAVLLGLLPVVSGGCAAAVTAAAAAGDIQRGINGVRQLISSDDGAPVDNEEVTVPMDLNSPLTGTYRATQVLGTDTATYYVRTVERPSGAIVDSTGQTTGYLLAGLAATSLDTLEARVGQYEQGETVTGNTIFFVEGTRAPEAGGRTLYAAAFLGGLAAGESAEADQHAAVLESLDLNLEAPALEAVVGQEIPHEHFQAVAEGVFTYSPDGAVRFEQEYEVADGKELLLLFERISSTTLPEPRWISAGATP